MNADLACREALADVEARERLAQESPKLSDRVIISVLAAYRRKRAARAGAIESARRRLRDACAGCLGVESLRSSAVRSRT